MIEKPLPSINDIASLLLLKLAKLNRKKFTLGNNYNEFYEEFFVEKDNESYLHDVRMRVRRDTILRYLKSFPENSKVLDVGCGLGDVLEQLPDHFRLYGVDYAESNVDYASKKLTQKAKIQQGNIYDLPFERDSFNICFCLEVLEHIEDDAKAVREISRVLRKGGTLIAAVPYTFYWKSYKILLGHFRHYTKDSFSDLLLGNGFSFIAEYFPNYFNWHQKYSNQFALLTAQYKTVGKFLGYKSVYEFKLPWQKKPAVRILEERLEEIRERDEKINYSENKNSTFIAAVK